MVKYYSIYARRKGQFQTDNTGNMSKHTETSKIIKSIHNPIFQLSKDTGERA